MVNPIGRSDNMTTGEFDFDYPVVNIGSHPENDLVLTGKAILPFHATVQLQNDQFIFYELGETSVNKIAGLPVKTGSVKFSPGQRVEIAGQILTFQKKSGSNGMHVSVSGPVEANAAPGDLGVESSAVNFSGESPIIVNSVTQQVDVQVGQTAVFELEIINAGPIVAGFSLAIQGIPKDWVKVEPEEINLFEGQHGSATVSVTPPRSPESTAGLHAIDVVTSSANYGGYFVQKQLSLNILPFYEFSVGNLSPKQQRIRWRKRFGVVKLPISNTGNSEADFNITAFDDENGCSFDFQINEDVERSRQATLNIQAGQSTSVPIAITPLKHPIAALRNKSYHYTATTQISEQSTLSQVVSGTAISVPLFGWWTILVSALLLIFGLFLLLQPRIYNFGVAAGKDIIVQGDSTLLDWSVSPFATTIGLSNTNQTIKRGENSLTVNPAQSTTYDLTASNWLSGLVGLNQKKSQTVLVIPPKPVINVFEVDRTSVPEGVPINLSWSVSKADKTYLTIDQVVYDLSPDKFSGTQQVTLTKSSLVTLKAVNASASELRSYFIKVVPPKITVNKFTVWVRPATTAELINPTQLSLNLTASLGGLSAFSRPVLANAGLPSAQNASDTPPDPNFPEKYVGLVADSTADSGYRVEFYEPNRELSKGEQVMIQWDISGADNNQLQIAPFTDVLPNRGVQPFFPQQSMNFVLTAKSGKLENIFMLPVTVFDGVPPTAPKIEFFQATPASMLGSGDVEFAWSVSGEWTLIKLATEDQVVGNYLNPQGFKTINITKSGTYILTACNNSLCSSSPKDITVNPALIDPGLTISSISTTRSQIGGKLDVTINFATIPTGSAYPTGSVIVTDGSAICQIPLPADTCSLQFTTSGTKSIIASFPGDAIYQQSQSPPYAQTVNVASAEVELIPSFYFNGSTSPISVESSTFDMAKGLHTIVEVRPKNTVLADNNGNINVSICDQDANEAVLLDTCTFIGAGQVKVASTTTATQTAGYGYADIVITNFTETGVHGLLFEYSHSNNAIDPTSVFQPNVHIARTNISISLASCTDPYNFTSCTYGLGTGTTQDVIFDINTPGDSGPIPLTTLLPSPQSLAFTVSSDGGATWACSVKPISGTYKLDCSVSDLVAGTVYNVTYSYDNTDPLTDPTTPTITYRNDYFMGTDPTIAFGTASFQLSVLASTRTIIGNLTGISVGEKIELTGPSNGLISIFNDQNVRIFPSTGVTLTETSGADVLAVAQDEGVNCTSGNGGSTITVTAANADCFIYLKHVGNYTFTATFAGDDQNNGSTSGALQVSVQKQTQIAGEVKYLDNTGTYVSGVPTQLTTNVAQSFRIQLTGPDSTFSPDDVAFPTVALADRNLLVTLSGWAAQSDSKGKPNCSIATSGQITDEGSSVYQVTISQVAIDPQKPASGYIATADFAVTCTSENSLGLSFTAVFSNKTTPKDSDDFAFSTAVSEYNIAVKPPSKGTMTISMLRDDTASTQMINSGAIDKLNFGMKYFLSLTGNNFYSHYQYTVNTTYLYDWSKGILVSTTTSPDKATTSQNARTSLLNSYTTNATWSVDPSNFLSLGTNLATAAGNTCGANMHLTAKQNGSESEYSSYYLSGYYYYWSGTDLYISETYTYTYYGSMPTQLYSTAAQKCTLQLDGTGSTNTAVTSTSGTIAVSAASGDGLFAPNNTYTVDGIDKQNVSMSLNPSSTNASPISGYTGIDIPVTITLANPDYTSNTPISFVGTSFSQYFSDTIDSNCTSLSATGSIISSVITDTYVSTATYSTPCHNTIQYLGNKYYLSASGDTYITIGKHQASVNFSSTPTFITSGAFTSVSYPNLSIHVTDLNPSATSPLPGGSVKLEVFNSSDALYNCSTASGVYTLTSSGISCDSSNTSYTLPVTNGDTASFSLEFLPGMVSSGNYIQLTYFGDSNFDAPASPTTSAAFEVKKHAASVGFTSTPQFITDGTLASAPGQLKYNGLVIQVQDADNPVHTSPVPTGTVVLKVMDSTGTAYDCGGQTPAYTLTGPSVTCNTSDNSYTLNLDNQQTPGATSSFTLDFTSFPASTTGNYIEFYYPGDSNFLAITRDTNTFASP